MSKEKMNKELAMKSKHKALKERTGTHKMHKTSHSKEYCRYCGEPTSMSVRHESGHREFDCVDAPGAPKGVAIKG